MITITCMNPDYLKWDNKPEAGVQYQIRDLLRSKEGHFLIRLVSIENELINGLEPCFHYAHFSYTDDPTYGLDYEVMKIIYETGIDKFKKKNVFLKRNGLYQGNKNVLPWQL